MAPAYRPRSLVRRILLNPAALGYLGLLAAIGLFVAANVLFNDSADDLVLAALLFLPTLPTGLLFVSAGEWSAVGMAASALFQAVLLGAVWNWLAQWRQNRNRRRRPSAPTS
ncbi:SCO4225 family membrane protein [Streptomyces sp. NPDC002845]